MQISTRQLTPEQLMALDDDTFRQIVDRDVRGDAPEATSALRTEIAINRWVAVLTAMHKSVEGQLASRHADFESTKLKFRRLGMLTETKEEQRQLDVQFLETAEKYEKTRSNSLRFKSGVEQVLTQARYLRDKTAPEAKYLRNERNQLLIEVNVLHDAIRRHRDEILNEGIDHSEIDEELWAQIPSEVIE